ncbi:uncharacterized protein LOC110990570 [Acanthaster planci]|uniref:Uncharacterized protein LOC110990570 n=1 Tax=Acanthaster planci TaxID=133434 RepID=A0A8B8A1T2_ACAPL|nr:uncharacterized protein LOC110990570 [Acanthaster planci]
MKKFDEISRKQYSLQTPNQKEVPDVQVSSPEPVLIRECSSSGEFERCSIKRSKLINNLAFLKRCHDTNILPPGLRVRDPIRNTKSQGIVHQYSLALLRHRIQATRLTLAHLDRQLSTAQDHVATAVSTEDFTKIKRMAESVCRHVFGSTRCRQIKKFSRLSKNQSKSHIPSRTIGSSISSCPYPTKPHLHSRTAFTRQTVVNLSHRHLSHTESRVLALGMKFTLVPRSPPIVDIIQSVEPALRHLNKSAADDARLHISQALKNHKPVKPNISKTEQQAIKSLLRDHSIHILTADKGNATVVMDKADYDCKVPTSPFTRTPYLPSKRDSMLSS